MMSTTYGPLWSALESLPPRGAHEHRYLLINQADRLGGLPASLAQAVAGMTSLRRGNHNLGPVKGQELLVRANAEGKRSYEFLWESQGRARSVEFPFMSLKLTTTAETNNGKIIEAPFKTDEEALKFWDAILQTIRLRPGAV